MNFLFDSDEIEIRHPCYGSSQHFEVCVVAFTLFYPWAWVEGDLEP